MDLKQRIQQLAADQHQALIACRRHLHQNPELSFQEYKTSAYLQEQLKMAGISFTNGHAGTGIIAQIEGKNPGTCTLLLRADMDALPIEENNEVPYKSVNSGVMHACGHDVHSTVVLGAAKILQQLRDQWQGRVKIMFQPGEELLPGGASLMIKAGVLRNPDVDKAIALHVFPEMEAGQVGFRKGRYMASTDELYVTINGKGGHAAMPANYNNPLLAAAAFLLETEKIFGKSSVQATPTVVAFGKIEGKGATNVIPDKVEIAGTLRAMDETWRGSVKEQLKTILQQTAAAYNCNGVLRIEQGYPCLVNDPMLTEQCFTLAREFLGEDKVQELPLRMTAEDFAYISQEVPSCFFRLGTGNKEKGITAGVHTANFDIDETALQTGAGLLSWLIIRELNH